MSEPDPRFCVICGHNPLRPGIDRSCPGGDVECWEVHCPKCDVYYDLHFDGCVVRDARKRAEAEIVRLRSACELALPFLKHHYELLHEALKARDEAAVKK